MGNEFRHDHFNECYEKYSAMIRSFILRMVKNPHISEELTNDLFMRLYEKRIAIDPQNPTIKTYLFTIARNLAMDSIRKTESEDKSLKNLFIQDVEPDADFYKCIEDISLDGNVISTMHDTIDSLPDREKEVLIDRFFRQKKLNQIARERELSLFLVNKYLNEAKRRIHMSLRIYYDE